MRIPALSALPLLSHAVTQQHPLSLAGTGVGTQQQCPLDGPVSCSKDAANADTCCTEHPGGQLLLTQFWDWHYSPYEGREESWTLHGLWPDHCDGSFDTFCDSMRNLHNITTVLLTSGERELFDFINANWLDNRGHNELFWEHEWNKHGTCLSTLKPECNPDWAPGEDLIKYFKTIVELYKTLPSYDFLKDAGIVPSRTTSYALADVKAALKKATGFEPTILCDGGGDKLHEIWYHFNLIGSIASGKFVGAEPDGPKGSCRATVYYLPKHERGGSPSKPGHPSPPSKPGSGTSGKIEVLRDDGSPYGCLLSFGEWSKQTCATFHLLPGSSEGLKQLRTRRGVCGVDANGLFSCSSTVRSAADFSYTATEAGALIGHGDVQDWSAAMVPEGNGKEKVYVGTEHGEGIKLVFMEK